MDDLKPTPDDIDSAGDALLEALAIVVNWNDPIRPEVGDLVVEVSSFALDWERVGYLLQPVPKDFDEGLLIWSVARRVVRWGNAAVRTVARHRVRLRSLPYPTPEEIEIGIAALASRQGGFPPKT